MKEAVRAIIIDEQGRVVLGKRARGIGEGQYALVGGKLDEDEEPIDAVVREVKEEVGLDFHPTHYLTKLDAISDPAEQWRVFYYSGPAEGEIHLKEDEIAEIVYVSSEELNDIDIAFDHRERLQEFFSNNQF